MRIYGCFALTLCGLMIVCNPPGVTGSLKRLRRSDYSANYRLNKFQLDERMVMFPLGDFGTIDKRDLEFNRRQADDDSLSLSGFGSGSGGAGGTNSTNPYTGEPASCHMPDSERIPCGHQIHTDRQYCERLGCCFNNDTYGTVIPVCFFHTVATTIFKREVFVSKDSQKFCPKNDKNRFLVGKYNKASEADMMCHNTETGITEVAHSNTETGYSDPIISLTTTQPFCQSPKVLYTGDLRNAYVDDLICIDHATGSVSTRLADKNNAEGFLTTGLDDSFIQFCMGQGQIFVADFDGDRWEDMLCVAGNQASDGRFLMKSDGTGAFMAPMRDPNYDEFCREPGAYIRVGNFDGDGRMDLLCVPEPGKVTLALTDGDGFLVNRDFLLEDTWCEDGIVYSADLNGDNRYDILCYNKTTGSICVRFNSNIFGSKHMFFQRYCEPTPFCTGGDISIADFNSDAMDDLYCHSRDGATEVAESVIRSTKIEFISIDYTFPSDRTSTETFCADKDNYVLDSNANNRQDFLCHENKGGLIELVYGDPYGHPNMMSHWSPPVQSDGSTFRFCYEDHHYQYKPHFLLADINGDGRKDMVCHYQEDGKLVYSPATVTGNFKEEKVLATDYCKEEFSQVYSGDFNGDKYEDIMCQMPDGKRLFAMSQGFASQQLAIDSAASGPAFCNGLDVHLVVGSFDSMNGDDLVCHIRETGEVKAMFANEEGKFTEVKTLTGIRSDWCTNANSAPSDLPGIIKVADYNGDHKADLLCHHSNGTISILYNKGEDVQPMFGDEFVKHMDFCARPGASVEVFDANGDGYADMTCHDSRGRIQIGEGHIVNIMHPNYQNLTNPTV